MICYQQKLGALVVEQINHWHIFAKENWVVFRELHASGAVGSHFIHILWDTRPRESL